MIWPHIVGHIKSISNTLTIVKCYERRSISQAKWSLMISRMLVRHTGHIAIATHCIAVSMSVPVHLLQAQCPPLYRRVHECACASATGTMSAWYKTCITLSMSVPVHLLQAQCPHGKDLYHFQLKLSNYRPISNLSFLPFVFLPFDISGI